MRNHRIPAVALAAVMTMSSVPMVHAASEFSDMPQGYSTDALEAAVANGLLQGSDGKILPEAPLTRAQMAAILVRAFGAEKTADLTAFRDVPADAWYHQELGAAVHMGLFQGDQGLMKPDAPITRQAAFAVLARAFSLDDGSEAELASYVDADQIAPGLRGEVAAMVATGFVKGDGAHLNPTASISRQQFAVVMDRMVETYLQEAGTVTELPDGSVMVREPDVTLKDLTVHGNLIVGDGVGEGDFTLDHVTVEGTVIVRGGGEDSVIVKGGSQLGRVVLAKVDGGVQLVVEDSSSVSELAVTAGEQPVTLKGTIGRLQVQSNTPVRLEQAKVDSMHLEAAQADVTVGKGSVVNHAVTAPAASGAKLEVSQGATVKKVTAEAEGTRITGSGKVEQAEVSGSHVSVETKGTQTRVAQGAEGVTAGGRPVSGGSQTTTPGSGSSSGGSGSGSSGGSSSGGSSSGSGDSSSGGSGSGDSSQTPAEVRLAEEARVEDLGWSRFVTVRFAAGNSLKNCTLTVDGVDVSAAATPVTDDGSIVKWEVTGDHAQLVISNGTDSQTVQLGGKGSAPEVLTEGQTPDYFLLNGPVYVWDYHLTNYDEAGNIRVSPRKTTFSVDGVSAATAIAHYSPDAVIYPDDGPSGVKGEAQLMFNYAQGTEAEKAFVDGITDVDLVSHDEYQKTLNGELAYTLDKAFAHGDHTVACIKVPVGQVNFTSNGRYNLRVTSNGEAKLFPIHLVNETVPSMTITGDTGATGKEVHFRISDMTYGITSPIYRVDLTGPDGQTETLAKFDDWFLHGDLLVLYNDKTNHFPTDGTYTVTVYADGFQTFSKTFHQTAFASAAAEAVTYDAIATASVSGGGSSGGEGGGDTNVMNANLIVDADLMINAKLMTALGLDNDAAQGIAARWDAMRKLSVFDEGAETVYTAENYFDAVNTARTQDRYLTFADYVASGDAVTTENRPFSVKQVLEDNLLGETTSFRDAVGEEAPALVLTAQTETSATFTCADKAYVAALAQGGELRLNNGLLKPQQYEVDAEAGTLTLTTVRIGRNTLQVRVPGYQTVEVLFEIEKKLEEASLSAADITKGQELVVTSTSEDFLKHIQSVTLTAPDGKTDIVMPEGTESLFEKIGYTVEGSTLTIGGAVMELDFAQKEDGGFNAGAYTVTVTSEYYGSRTVTLQVSAPAEPEVPEEPEVLTAPAVDQIVEQKGIADSYYTVSFQGDEAAAEAYLKAVTKITVDGTELKKVTSFFQDTGSYKVSNDPSFGGAYCLLDFTKDCLTGARTVVISAEGYTDLTFAVKDGVLGGAEPEVPEVPEVPAAPAVKEIKKSSSFSGDYYTVSFQGDEDAAEAYLKAVTKITVDGTELKKVTSFFQDTGSYKVSNDPSFGGAYCLLDFTKDCLTGARTVVISAEGYTDLTFAVKDGVLGGAEPEEPEVPEVPAAPAVKEIKKSSSFSGDYYTVSFQGDEAAAEAYLKAVTKITVDGTELKKVTSFFQDTGSYKVSNDPSFGGAYCLLDFTKDCLTGARTVVISAEGYTDLTFAVKDGVLGGAEPEEPEVPEVPAAPAVKEIKKSSSFSGDSYTVSFQGDESTTGAYVGAITRITANGKELKKVSSFFGDKGSYKTSNDPAFGGEYCFLDFTMDCFQGKVTLVISAEGYADLTFTVQDGVLIG